MNLFIQSCHASLEYDHARMFNDLGYKVFGNWDLGSIQRPKIRGVTDENSDIGGHNFIILHQVPEYTNVMKDLLEKGKTVVLIGFGQSDTWQYEFIADLCRKYTKAYVAAYSVKDFRRYEEQNCPKNKLRLLRFGKYLTDYAPWIGNLPVCYVSCNSIHKRGTGCGWHILEQMREELPIIISGKDTQEVGGLGEIPEIAMRSLFNSCGCFLSFGTAPAALVMTQMEAWCAGCPTVCYNNGFGLHEEEMPLILSKNVGELITQVKTLLSDEEYRNSWHEKSLENAARFDVKVIGQQWVTFLKEINANI